MSNLEGQLRAFSKTAKFKKLCDEAKKKAGKEGLSFGQASGATVRTPEFYAKEMRRILHETVAKIRSKETGEGYLDHIAYKVHEDGAEVYFEPSEMTRPSLDPAYNGPDGFAVDNIAVLINNGYRAAGSVLGVDRHGTERWSLRERTGKHFMQEAVDEFNSKYGNEVFAELSAKYW